MNIIIRILLALLAIILCAAIVMSAIMFFYYPRYKKEERNREIEITEKDKIKVMSCNVRCLNPLDRGKRSWFYRANLLLDVIEEAAPGVIGFQ